MHYNQHGLLLLAGQGIYRLADSWTLCRRGCHLDGTGMWCSGRPFWGSSRSVHPVQGHQCGPGCTEEAQSVLHACNRPVTSLPGIAVGPRAIYWCQVITSCTDWTSKITHNSMLNTASAYTNTITNNYTRSFTSGNYHTAGRHKGYTRHTA